MTRRLNYSFLETLDISLSIASVSGTVNFGFFFTVDGGIVGFESTFQ